MLWIFSNIVFFMFKIYIFNENQFSAAQIISGHTDRWTDGQTGTDGKAMCVFVSFIVNVANIYCTKCMYN
jgi:hypothetical protein